MKRFFRTAIAPGIAVSLCLGAVVAQQPPPERDRDPAPGFSASSIERPLRYTPVGGDFVITNGGEFFNRPLYGGSLPLRVDAGDMPEFSLYLPGHGGNLRLGLRRGDRAKWLHEAREVVARYRPGKMLYEVRDELLGGGVLKLEAVVSRGEEGLLVRAESSRADGVELVFAFGGVDGKRGRRNGDVGCEVEPVSRFFQLRPEQCRSNAVTVGNGTFVISGRPGLVGGAVSGGGTPEVADAKHWSDCGKLITSAGAGTELPLVVGSMDLRPGEAQFIGIHHLSGAGATASNSIAAWNPSDLVKKFSDAETARRAVAERLVVETPDPFVDAAVGALNVAEDAVWDERQQAYLHGGVAWRVRLLGWRVSYAGDVMGNHERTAKHFEGFVREQNKNPIPAVLPAPEESANLSRNETALHSNGNMTKNHYDMNLVGVDAFFRHLSWTGDLDFARRMWPAIERHFAWERRMFRREFEFGSEKLPLYEAYACIWASDDLAYNGGGATHSSAYNLYHNRMAARVAKLIGADATPFEREAELIERGMKQHLWLKDRGWFAEWKDLLGLQLVHPNAAAWTFYHTVDSEVPSPQEAWQMTRFMDTQIARFPLRGPGVPPGNETMPTTSWMPYMWSLNNVVFGETMHTSLAYWQANRPEGAFPLFKGALLDSMYLGVCPGNVGMCTWFDAVRRESQRDFGDGVGAMSRTVIEGLFGVKPDLLAGEIVLRPGFPSEWNNARIRHRDLDFRFQREGKRETYTLETSFAKPVRLRLQSVALRDGITRVTVNGREAKWRALEDSVGAPRIEIETPAAAKHEVAIEWSGEPVAPPRALPVVVPGGTVEAETGAAIVETISDPQAALSSDIKRRKNGFSSVAQGTTGHRTVFAKVNQGALKWWLPVTFEIRAQTVPGVPVDWSAPIKAKFEVVEMARHFNDSVTQIFRNAYRSPRSPFVSLATPKQGIGSWCLPNDQFDVDDSGLRKVAAANGGKLALPNGVPLATTGDQGAKNIAFVSQWDNYPREITVPLGGKSSRAFLLMAGSTDAMKSRFDNGEVVVTYADGSVARLALHNPTTWWPIDQDYYIDDFAFARPEPLPVRVDLKTGKVRVLEMESFKGQGRHVPGGAATVLDLPLDSGKELKSLTVRAIANEVVIGLMSVTLQR